MAAFETPATSQQGSFLGWVADGTVPGAESGCIPLTLGNGVTVCASAEIEKIPTNNAEHANLHGDIGSPSELFRRLSQPGVLKKVAEKFRPPVPAFMQYGLAAHE